MPSQPQEGAPDRQQFSCNKDQVATFSGWMSCRQLTSQSVRELTFEEEDRRRNMPLSSGQSLFFRGRNQTCPAHVELSGRMRVV
ncbi:hypothetical protein A0U92_11890 [Acetobacter aceti]|uniref:Uncharacterized protein n=1 Tax=Acetobacter aceti TaxID=435 RepID=A0A1U9KHT7_ACEAC|nr:hypothetical protein A0U92_11890 [Acetobacter aceti]